MIATRGVRRAAVYEAQRLEAPRLEGDPPTGLDSPSRVFEPGPDHWMLTVAILAVTACTAALPSPLMVGVAALSLCALAPSENLPAMLAIGAVIATCLLLVAL